MATTRTSGITIDTNGNRIINKQHRGVRVSLRLGQLTQVEAERRLHQELERVEIDLRRRATARPRFATCAARYLAESKDKRTADDIAAHVRLLIPHLGHLEAQQVHDGTLQPFIAARLEAGVSNTTINRALEIVRTILNRAARAYRDDDGRLWLDGVPPLITMLPETHRAPYPITWDEQDRLFPRLPAHLQRMVLFAVNTGARSRNVCRLEWMWEIFVPEVGRSVFVIPPEAFKTKRPHVLILNDAAWSIVQAQRGLHPIWVFPLNGKPIGTMNNTAWKSARRKVGLPRLRIHDLRHTFASRLRAAGVSAEDREVLLGHSNRSMAGHYASADIGRLIQQTNLILKRSGTCTILRVATG